MLPDGMAGVAKAADEASDLFGNFDVFVSGRRREGNAYSMSIRVDARQNTLFVAGAHMQNFANRVTGLFGERQPLPQGVRQVVEPQDFGGGRQVQPSFFGDLLRAAGHSLALGVDCIVEAVCQIIRASFGLMRKAFQ